MLKTILYLICILSCFYIMNYSDYWVYIRSWWLPWVIITHATFLLLYHTLQRKSDPTNLKIKIFSRERTCWSDKKIPRKNHAKFVSHFRSKSSKIATKKTKIPKRRRNLRANFLSEAKRKFCRSRTHTENEDINYELWSWQLQ